MPQLDPWCPACYVGVNHSKDPQELSTCDVVEDGIKMLAKIMQDTSELANQRCLQDEFGECGGFEALAQEMLVRSQKFGVDP
jgi:hypothetical protein